MAGLTQAAQRPAHRSALRCGEVVLARPSDSMGLFRGVDENEEHRERTGREPRRFWWQGAGPREQRVQVRYPRDAEPSGAARPSQLLDRPEWVFTRQPADDATERRREPTHVLAQLCVLRPGYRRRKRNGRGDVGR